MRLRDLIALEDGDVACAVEKCAKSEPRYASLSGQVAGLALREGARRLNDTLDADPFELLATAWTRVRLLQEYADPARHPPGETAVVTLGEHRLKGTWHPVLEVAVGGSALPGLRFTLEVELQFRSVGLGVEDGAIRSVAPGTASVSARLKYGKVKLQECPSRSLKLPGRLVLDPGLRIPAAGD
jgi:hypothetical protein